MGNPIDAVGLWGYISFGDSFLRIARTARTWSEEHCRDVPSRSRGWLASGAAPIKKEEAVRVTIAWFCLLACLPAAFAADLRVEETARTNAAENSEDPKGSLVIIGGSERFRDRELWDTIVELAGGDGAKIAGFPTAASGQPVKSCAKLVQTLNRAGADAFIAPVAWSEVDRDVSEAVFDPELVERVRSATGVYFVGGAQGRIVDALLDDNKERTPMLDAIWEVYRRGGVIAGHRETSHDS